MSKSLFVEVFKIVKTHSARPLHDLRKILLCILHRASGADSEWNKVRLSDCCSLRNFLMRVE